VSADQPIDVRDMAIVHQTFRRSYQESAALVRANPTPSAHRVDFLADHVDFGISLLHHHHAGEDELLYPLLLERAPDQAASTEHIEHEHQEVAGHIDAVSAACAAWRAAPSAASGEELATALDELNARLQEHLDDEEREIVPLAAVTLTQEEWETLGRHAMAAIPKDKLGIAFGMLTEPLSDDDRHFMRSHLPAPVRLLSPLVIDRPWHKYRDQLRNGT
jgi:hemerythrin-like domain-containing protein